MSESKHTALDELWDITLCKRFVDRERLAEVVREVSPEGLDERSRELVRASQMALRGESTEATRFPSLAKRIGNAMTKDTILRYLRALDDQLTKPCGIIVGGSSALILRDQLLRNTEDIDVVDEVPSPIRELHAWRATANERFGLYVAHFQSHYLPRAWESRVETVASFRRLDVALVDSADILVGKLFSKRDKDLDDIREVEQHVGRETIDSRLAYADRLAADPKLLALAQRNYYILWGEDLPAIEPAVQRP